MTRYYGHLVIEFVDGTVERVGGNKHRVHDGILTVWTDSAYASKDHRYFPLSSVKSFEWDES